MSYRQDCENITNDLKEYQAREDERRKEELAKVEEQMKTNMEQLAELRKFEAERREKEEERHEKSLEAVADRHRKAYEANLDKQDRRLNENHKKEEESINNHQKALEKQKEFLSTEIKNKTISQLETMKQREKKLQDETERAAKKVVALNGERLAQQQKLSEDLEKYHKEHQATLERHITEKEEKLEEQQNLLVDRERNALQAKERLQIQEQEYKGHVMKVVTCVKSDQTEVHFINAVMNTKTVGREATSAISKLGDNAYRLKSGQARNETIADTLKKAITVEVSSKLDELKVFASSVLEQLESSNEKADDCHEAARGIDAAIIKVEDSLREFKASLDDDPIDNSIALYKQVVDDCKELGVAVSSMPAVSKSNHVIGQIVDYTEKMVIRTSRSAIGRNEN